MEDEIKTAKATYGLCNVIVVADCPYCHGRHEHRLDSDFRAGTREADCLKGQYIFVFEK